MDRRYYQRTKLNVDTVLLLSDKTTFPREFSGTLEDISRSGIKITVDKNSSSVLKDNLSVNDTIHFDSYDEYSLFNEDLSTVIYGDAKVVRIENSPEKMVIGCILNPLTSALEQYITDKETCAFITKLL